MRAKNDGPPISLSIRIDVGSGRIGPGKLALLEAIRDHGSITAAAAALGGALAPGRAAGHGARRLTAAT